MMASRGGRKLSVLIYTFFPWYRNDVENTGPVRHPGSGQETQLRLALSCNIEHYWVVTQPDTLVYTNGGKAITASGAIRVHRSTSGVDGLYSDPGNAWHADVQ